MEIEKGIQESRKDGEAVEMPPPDVEDSCRSARRSGDDSERERCMILDRFLGDEDLECLGTMLEIPWFEGNEVGFENRGVAQETLALELETVDELQRALDEFSTVESTFPWFFGEHYSVEALENRKVVSEGKNIEARRDINKRVAEANRSDDIIGTALDDAVRNGHVGLSEIRTSLNFCWTPDDEGKSRHERASTVDEIPGVRVSEGDRNRRGYRARIALEVADVIVRGASGVLPADVVIVESEVLERKDDPEETFRCLLPSGSRLSTDEEFWVDERRRGHGYMRVKNTSPDGRVEITDTTEVRIETEDDRASVMSDELSEERRIEVGMADLIVQVLRCRDDAAGRDSIVKSVGERLSPDRDVYHLMDGCRKDEITNYVNLGLNSLCRKGEAYKTEEGYMLTQTDEDK